MVLSLENLYSPDGPGLGPGVCLEGGSILGIPILTSFFNTTSLTRCSKNAKGRQEGP